MNRLQIFAERRVHTGRIELHISKPATVPGLISIAKPLVFESIEEGYLCPESAVSLTQTEAQMLMDELWNAGLRPSQGSGSAGSLAATERHLEDMRTMAFGLLKGEF